MLYTQSPLTINDASDNPSLPIGSIPSLPIVLTASTAIFLAVDATITLFRRRTREPTPIVAAAAAADPAPVPSPPPPACQSLTRFVDKTRSILADVQALEKQLNSEKARRRRLSLQRQRLSQDPGRRPDPTTSKTKPKPKTHRHHHHHQTPESTSGAFSAFCDRLLLTNQIWKQEKELKALRASAASTTQAQHDTAFTTFCEQLLLWNRIWTLEREAAVLAEEKERIQRERTAAVTRAAKRMVVDVQKERLVEEFVKDLIGEVAAAKEEVAGVRREWECGVREMNGEWMREYRRVRGEVERLRLAQEARLVEQEVANAMEESLFERLREGKRRVEALEEKIAGYASEDEVTLNDADGGCADHDDDATDVELDTISELSTSSTCVSSGGSIKRPVTTTPQRRRCVSQGAAPAPGRTSMPTRTSTLPNLIDASSFTLKPLMIDHAKSASTLSANMAAATRTCNHSGRPLAVRNRTTSVVLRSPNSNSNSESGSAVKAVTKGKARAPWRV